MLDLVIFLFMSERFDTVLVSNKKGLVYVVHTENRLPFCQEKKVLIFSQTIIQHRLNDKMKLVWSSYVCEFFSVLISKTKLLMLQNTTYQYIFLLVLSVRIFSQKVYVSVSSVYHYFLSLLNYRYAVYVF